MAPIKFETFRDTQSKSVLQKMMKDAVTAAAGKGKIYYVAAKNYKTPIKKETIPLFLIVDQAHVEQFRTVIKAAGGVVSKGQASVVKETKDNKITNKIIVHTAEGALAKDKMGADIKTAIGVTPSDTAWVAHSEEQEEEAQEKEHPTTRPDPVKMVRASIAQAKREGILEPDSPHAAVDAHGKPVKNIAVGNEIVDKMAAVRGQVAEYGKFVQAYENVAAQYGLTKYPDYKGIPYKIWHDLLKNMAASGYITEHIPNVGGDANNLILAYTGKQGQVVREELLKQAMAGMDVYIQHASTNLSRIVDAIKESGGKSWAFWSGRGAEDAAKNSGGVALEGTIGAWFSKIWKFEHLTGVNDLVLWTSMSELYAKAAADYFEDFSFIGFLGPTATREQSVFNKIEQPTFVEVLNVKKQVSAPKIDWFVVDCTFAANDKGRDTYKGAKGFWNWTHKESQKFDSRTAALAEITARYEG